MSAEEIVRNLDTKEKRNAFLQKEQDHILHLTARILKRTVSWSDDECSVALIAVNEAIDSYDESKGKFWNYSALVISSRLKDFYRSNSKYKNEVSVGNDAFDGDIEENEEQLGIHIEIRDKTAVYVNNKLRDELYDLQQELESYNIDLFELPMHAPKSQKTKRSCAEIIAAIFIPPPLIDELKRSGKLPVKEIMNRVNVKRKLIDDHRKYLIASALIKAGDYPMMSDYLTS